MYIRETYLRITHIHLYALKQWYMNWIIVVEKKYELVVDIIIYTHTRRTWTNIIMVIDVFI